jgi:S-adenosylmethionine decarboxylase
MHVIVDGFGGDPDQLADENVVRAILDLYPEAMGMTKIAPPTVVRYRGTKPEDWGVSGYVMIAESHISLHTFPERCLIWADIFSCKDFDATAILADLKSRFHLRTMEVQTLKRELEPVAVG